MLCNAISHAVLQQWFQQLSLYCVLMYVPCNCMAFWMDKACTLQHHLKRLLVIDVLVTGALKTALCD